MSEKGQNGRTRKAITFAFYFPRLDVSGARAKTKTKMPVTLALIKPEALKNGYAPAIEATLPLTSEGVAEAFRRLHSRRVRGKIVVEVT